MFPQRALVHWENPPTTLQLIRRRKIENIQHIFDGIWERWGFPGFASYVSLPDVVPLLIFCTSYV